MKKFRRRSREEEKAIFAKLLGKLGYKHKTFRVEEYQRDFPHRVKEYSGRSLPKSQVKVGKDGVARFVSGYGQNVPVSDIKSVKHFLKPGETGGLVYKIYKTDGKIIPVYNEEGLKRREKRRIASTIAIAKKLDTLRADAIDLAGSKDPYAKQYGVVLHLIGEHGVRIGTSQREVRKDHYGATTLQARHFIRTKDGYLLRFVGKSGVPFGYKTPGSPQIVVRDKTVVSAIDYLKRGKKPTDRMFSDLDYKSVWKFMQTNYGSTAKSLRTYIASKTFFDLAAKTPVPKTERERKSVLKKMFNEVAVRLGHVRRDKKTGHLKPSPATTKKSYIIGAIVDAWTNRKLGV